MEDHKEKKEVEMKRIPRVLDKESGTSDSSQEKGLSRVRMPPDQESALPSHKNSILDGLSARIQRVPAVSPKQDNKKKWAEELNAYLNDKVNGEFNLDLFHTISAKEGKSFSVLRASRFFKQLYNLYNYVKENKANLGLVLNRIAQLERSDLSYVSSLSNTDPDAKGEWENKLKRQFHHLLYSLAMLIRNGNEVDGDIQDIGLRHCLIAIERELANRIQDSHSRDQMMREVRSVVLKRKFDFAKVQNDIKALPDTNAKLQYLMGIQLEYNQQDIVDESISKGFGRKCQLEIDTIKEMMALEQPSKGQTESQIESEDDMHNPEFTTARQVLAIHYLLDAAQANIDNKSAEARFIRFLTSRNQDAITNSITELRERGNPSDKRSRKIKPRSPKTRKEDLEFVKSYFEDLKIKELVNAINDEIEDIGEDSLK